MNKCTFGGHENYIVCPVCKGRHEDEPEQDDPHYCPDYTNKTRLLEEIADLKHENKLLRESLKKLTERVTEQRQKAYEAMEANAHEYTRGYAQRYVDMQEAGLQEIMQKAEKWDKMKWHTSCPAEDADCAISPELENVKDDLKTIMAGLMIDRSCATCKGTGINPNFGGSCVVCEGSGKVSRTARAEDVREFIEQTLKLFPLKDGAVLRVDFPYV